MAGKFVVMTSANGKFYERHRVRQNQRADSQDGRSDRRVSDENHGRPPNLTLAFGFLTFRDGYRFARLMICGGPSNPPPDRPCSGTVPAIGGLPAIPRASAANGP
jgi:hypothetical protein